MSWQLACGVVLALVLVGGFAWYERSRPSSRIVSLVAALAVFAVAGRLAFAPVPNVVATTDIVLITGLVLGAAPGFACGALAALVSNFWLGQGPWTPWQMAAWGLVGIAGALLAKLGSGNPSRWVLAAACGLAAFGFGAIMDLSLMTSFGGEQSLDRFLALTVTSLPFTIAHAVGNVAMALVAGPALVRMLVRFRTRFEFVWAPPGLAPIPDRGIGGGGAAAAPARSLAVALLALVLAAGIGVSSLGQPDQASAAADGSAVAYLQQSQNSDGGFGVEPGSSSSTEMTGWSALGLAAHGINPLDVKSGGRSPIDFLRRNSSDISATGDLERTILALSAAGVNPRDFAGRDLVGELAGRKRSNGSWEGQVNLTAFAIMALRAGGLDSSSVAASADWLRGVQSDDGGWGINKGAAGEPDSTGAALQALAVAPGGGKAVADGLRFLDRVQRSDGGFELSPGAGSNSQSTAWAIQGSTAAGGGSLTKGGSSAGGYLAARQRSDGHFTYSKSSDQTPIWVTAQAMVAAAGSSYPIAEVARAPREPKGPAGNDGGDGQGGGVGAAGRSGGGANSGSNAKSKRRSKRSNRSSKESDRSASAGARVSAGSAEDPLAADLAPASVISEETPKAADAAWLLGGLGALALGLIGGFVWYRRRALG